MNDLQERERLFLMLKQALKAKGVTYATLAKGLSISELSVKRLFRDKDCKMSRILDICSLLNMTLTDLFQMHERVTFNAQYLPEELEAELAKDKHLFTLFIFLISRLELPHIQQTCGMDEPTFYLSLRKLENIGLIELNDDKQFRFRVPLPIRWRLDGPLGRTLKQVNQNYISYAFENANQADYLFNSTSRLMNADSAQKIQKILQECRQEFDNLSSQDQLFYEDKDLTLYKFVTAMTPFPVEELMPFKK